MWGGAVRRGGRKGARGGRSVSGGIGCGKGGRGGRCEEANEVLRSGDEVAAVGLEDGVTELEDVVGDEVAILVLGSVASNTLLGVGFPTGGYRAGARAGDSYSNYSQD
jgi:hypothetical protein